MPVEFLYKEHKLNIEPNSLLKRGFVLINGKYIYERSLDDTFLIRISIDQRLHDEVFDVSTNEPYTLYKLSALSSGFAYSMKQNVESIIEELFPELRQEDPFSTPSFRYLEDAMIASYSEPSDNPFEEDDIRIFRLKQNRKWYGLAMKIPAKKLGFDGDNEIFGLCVRVEKGCAERYINHQVVFPAYHMNKKNWVNLILDGRMSDDEVLDYLRRSRTIVLEGK